MYDITLMLKLDGLRDFGMPVISYAKSSVFHKFTDSSIFLTLATPEQPTLKTLVFNKPGGVDGAEGGEVMGELTMAYGNDNSLIVVFRGAVSNRERAVQSSVCWVDELLSEVWERVNHIMQEDVCSSRVWGVQIIKVTNPDAGFSDPDRGKLIGSTIVSPEL